MLCFLDVVCNESFSAYTCDPSKPSQFFCKVNVFKPAYAIELVGTTYFRYNQIVELANYNQIVELELELQQAC